MENQQRKRIRRKDDRELEIQYELLKIIAEQNKELLFNYDVEYDKAIIYEVRNGEFFEKESYDNYLKEIDSILKNSSEKDKKLFKKALSNCLKKESHEVFEIQIPNEKGKKEWYRVFLASIGEVAGEITTIAGRFISVHNEKIATEAMRHRAEIDALTGVYNHITFESMCEEKLSNNQSEMLLLMLDVDDFKMINDSLGHNVGDLVLCQTGKVIRDTVGERGFAGRLGGDEFALLVWGFSERDEIVRFCNDLNRNLKNIIFDMEYSASMGAAIRFGRDLTFKDLYYEADQAVYSAKKNGKNQIVFYDEFVESEKIASENAKNDLHQENNAIMLSEFDQYIVDQRPEYVFVISQETKKVIFANRSAQEAMIHKDDKWKNVFCYDLFRGCDKECSNCNSMGENYYVSYAKNRKTDTLSNYYGESDFMVHMLPENINGEPLIVATVTNLGDNKHINAVMKKRTEVLSAVRSCMDFISSNVNDVDYNNALQLISDFYGADSVFLIDYNEGKYNKCKEIHKPNFEMMSSVVMKTIEAGGLLEFKELADENGDAMLVDIKNIEAKNPRLYKRFVDCRIWSLVSKRLFDKGDNAGEILILNPRTNVHETNILELICAYLTGVMLRSKLEKMRDYENSHDKLTGLWNRSKHKEMRSTWDESSFTSLGVYMTDIIHLKEINKEMSYQIGNEHIIQVKEVLESVFKGFDMFRYDDDEFLVMCPNIEMTTFQNMIKWVGEKLVELNLPVATGSSWSSDVNIANQIAEAEEMIVVDKNNQYHDGDFDKRKNAKICQDIEKEILDGNFLVYLQPKVNIEADKTIGAEALIRLKHPDFGIVGPAFYIDMLEEQNLVHLIDLFVLEKVCEFQQAKYRGKEETIPISVNFSKKTLLYSNLIRDVRRIIDRYDLPTGLIQIEITESIGDMDHMFISNIVNSLRSMGFVLAMDDFGTKYSNIAMIFKFQFEIAKIDRSLVREITTNKMSCTILRHIIAMFNDLDLECVVEGAETQEQIDLLKDMNCKIVQGFFYGKPVAIEEFYDKFMA